MTKINVKKTAAAIVIVFFMLFLTACSKGSADASGSSAQAANGEFATGKQGQKSNPPSAAYEVVKQTYTDRNVKINYPQVADMSDSKKQEKINELMKTDALAVARKFDNLDDVSININYEIAWQGEDLLSIKYSGMTNLKGAAHPTNAFYTTNIDMLNGKRLRLGEIIKVNGDFVEKIKKGNLKVISPEITFDHLSYTNNELIEALNIADEGRNDVCSYFTKDSLGISIEVPHVIGDHVEVEMRYQDIADNIKKENELWKSFFSGFIK